MGDRLSVTLISSLAPDGVVVEPPKKSFAPAPVEPPPPIPPAPPIWEQQLEEPSIVDAAIEEPAETAKLATEIAEFAELDPEPVAEIEEQEIAVDEPPSPPAPPPVAPKKKLILPKEPKPAPEKKYAAKQEVLQFEPVTRGRFEKSEPTIVEGQDLDVPTFLRKNVRVK
jgi:cell division protein FtsZ